MSEAVIFSRYGYTFRRDHSRTYPNKTVYCWGDFKGPDGRDRLTDPIPRAYWGRADILVAFAWMMYGDKAYESANKCIAEALVKIDATGDNATAQILRKSINHLRPLVEQAADQLKGNHGHRINATAST